jgi:hypothetical protein
VKIFYSRIDPVTSERLLSVTINNNNNNNNNNNDNNNKSVVFSVKCNHKVRKINIFWDMIYNLVVRY